MPSERICPWERIRRAIGPPNGSASSLLNRSSADFIIIIAGYSLRQAQVGKQASTARCRAESIVQGTY
jgi:hypothetical protein